MLDLLTIFGYSRWLTFFSINFHFFFTFAVTNITGNRTIIYTWYDLEKKIQSVFPLESEKEKKKKSAISLLYRTPIQKCLYINDPSKCMHDGDKTAAI